MVQYVPAFLAAAALLGALVSWYGPYRNASIERDNHLRALYGDLMKAMLAINDGAREDYEMERQGLRVQIMMGAYRAKSPPEQCAYLRERR